MKSKKNASAPEQSTHTHPAPGAPVADRSLIDAVAPDLASVADDPSVSISLDIALAVAIVTVAAEKVHPLRGAILAVLPNFPVAELDRLPARMQALLAAQALYVTANATPPDGEDLPAAIATRDRMRRQGQSLVEFGFLPAAEIAAVGVNRGYHDVGTDLMLLASAFGNHWPALVGQTPVTAEQVAEARALGGRLVQIPVRREQAVALRTEATALRRRLFILFARSYDEVRRAVAYLRWHEGDANEIAPSFYTRPGNTTRHAAPSEQPPPTAPVTAPVATTPASPAPAAARVATTPSAVKLAPEDNPLEDP